MARRSAHDIVNEVMRARTTPRDMMRMAEQLSQSAHSQIDLGYIKTLLFPELYNADIPQPMSTQSYTRFTDKKEVSFTSQGAGILLWYPKTNIGPQIWLRGDQNVTAAVPFGIGAWTAGGFQDYQPYFTQTNLVSASISLQYIGQLQNEQGFFVASQLYGVSPSTITANDIENGQFRVMSKPGDGVRSVYLPKDMNDFTYYNCGYTIANTASIIRTKNGGKNPENDVIDFAMTAVASNYMENVVPAGVAAGTYSSGGQGCKFRYQSDADCIAIYWNGLKSGVTNDLRVDIVRKFNGFPQASQRDVLDLIKPKKLFDPKRTIDVIGELQMAVPQLAGHSLKQMDRVSDQIQEFLPNIGHLYNEGMLKEGSSLEGFSNQLQMLSGTEGNGAVIGRVYD